MKIKLLLCNFFITLFTGEIFIYAQDSEISPNDLSFHSRISRDSTLRAYLRQDSLHYFLKENLPWTNIDFTAPLEQLKVAIEKRQENLDLKWEESTGIK